MKKAIIFLGILVSSFSYSQATNGMSGLIHIPSARMLEDGQLILGAAYIPKPFLFRYNKSNNPGLYTYITYAILPFTEIMFRYSHELNIPVNNDTRYFPDRMLGLRFRLFKEKNFLPSLVIGLQDISEIIGGTCFTCSNYPASYVVASKNIDFKNLTSSISAGFTFDINDHKSHDFRGLFFGADFSIRRIKYVKIIFEYDSKYINAGLKYSYKKLFNAMFGFRDLKKITYSLNISI
jgi:hypothetical protein